MKRTRARAYYNEIDAWCAAWLRSLIRAGVIADGDVDERDIREVRADEIRGYTQCHFFAGIGGWSRALRLAAWRDTSAVWTGSCPCQPFSAAGRRAGRADARHLWPEWFRLIRECKPAVVFGEQVAAAIAFGWLDEVFDDLEGQRYACAAAVLPACGVGAPHRRERLWFVADAAGQRGHGSWTRAARDGCAEPADGRGGMRAVGDAHEQGSQGRPVHSECSGQRSPWSSGLVWITGADGKSRPVKSRIRVLADGVPGRVGRLRAYGNAIVPQLAAEFVRAARSRRN